MMSTAGGRSQVSGRVRDLFWAGVGAAVLLIQLPIVKMILDDTQELYFGSWDAATFLTFLLVTFVLVPGAIGAVCAGLFWCSAALGLGTLCMSASYLLAKQIDFHYLLFHFTTAPWRKPVVVLLWIALAALAWRTRHRLVRLLKVCAVFSLLLLVWFSYQASPWSIRNLRHTAKSPATMASGEDSPSDVPPVFLLTFEKIVSSYVLDDQGRVLSDRFPKLASFVQQADLYPQAYANTGSTTYSLKTLYTGRLWASQKDWAKSPNIRDILGEDRDVVMVLDPFTMEYCRPSYDRCFRSIGVDRTTGLELIKGWYKTYAYIVLPGFLQAKFALLGWRFDPRTTLWAREENTDSDHPEIMAHQKVGVRQLEHLAQGVRECGARPCLYIMHNYMTDAPGVSTSVLTGRTPEQQRDDLEAARRNLALFDQQIGAFFHVLKTAGLYDRSLIVITADTAHDPGLMYVKGEPELPWSDEMGRVFLAIKRPGQREGRVIQSAIQHIDVLPTVLHDLGIDPSPFGFQGQPVVNSQDTVGLAEHPLEFVIPTRSAGILYYRLNNPIGPMYKMNKRDLKR